MHAFRAAHAAAADWLQAANNCLRTLGDIPGSGNLGFLYVTDAFAPQLPQVLGLLRTETGIDDWVGSIGTGVCGNGREYHEEGAISVLLGSFRAGSFQVFPPLREEIAELAESARPWAQTHGARFGVVHGDPQNPRVAELVHELTEALEGGFLVGGLTSSRGPHWRFRRVRLS